MFETFSTNAACLAPIEAEDEVPAPDAAADSLYKNGIAAVAYINPSAPILNPFAFIPIGFEPNLKMGVFGAGFVLCILNV